MLRDMRFAIRMLLKQPAFSSIAVLTLALGIGATSAVFSLIQGVLLTPPPYRQPQQLVLVLAARTDGQPMDNPRGWAAQQWTEWQKEAKSFQGFAGYNWTFNFLVRNAGGGQRTELRRKRDGGFLGPSRAEPKRAERALLEHGGAASRPRNAAARAAGVDPAGRQRSAGGEGL